MRGVRKGNARRTQVAGNADSRKVVRRMRMLIGGIFVGALAALVVIEILVCLRADSRREKLRTDKWEHDVDERIARYSK